MHFSQKACVAIFFLLPVVRPAPAQQPENSPLPDIHQLMTEVEAHQKQLDKVRENYTFTSLQTKQDIDGKGQIKKTETSEYEQFFVNGQPIGRLVKKDGKPLDDHEQQKETERINKLTEKAAKQQPGDTKQDDDMKLSRILEIMDVRNPRRLSYHGRSTIVFDFVGRKDAKTHGMGEDMSKKLQGSIWIDEKDRQIAHVDATFYDNFHLAGGLLANVQKGSNMRFDQAPVNGEIWLPTGGEGTIEMRLLLVKGIREHVVERDYDYRRFSVETEQGKNAKVVGAK
jgi:hypothetical protein